MRYPLFLSAIHYGLAQQAAAETPSCRPAVGSARALEQSLQATQVPPRSPPKLQRSHLNAQGNHLHTRGDGEQASCLQKHPFNPWVWMKRGVNQWPNCSSSGCWKREGEEAPVQGSMLLHTGLIPKEVNSVLYSEVGSIPLKHNRCEEYPKLRCTMDNWGRQTMTAETRGKPSNPELLC